LIRLNEATGASAGSNIGTLAHPERLVTNGIYVFGRDSGSNDDFYRFADLYGTGSETGPFSYTSTGTYQILDFAIDGNYLFIGGSAAGGAGDRLVKCVTTVAPGSTFWDWDPPTTTQPVCNALATDGDYLWVGTDRAALSAGGNANLYLIEKLTGTMLYAYDIGNNSDDVTHLALDDQYIVVTTYNTSGGAHNEVWILDYKIGAASMGSPIEQGFGANMIAWDTDGIGYVLADNNPSPKEVGRNLLHNYPRQMQRVDGRDKDRQPFHNLAIPTRR
jgi:hypothetical protein